MDSEDREYGAVTVFAIVLHFGDGGAFYTEETVQLFANAEDAEARKIRFEEVRAENLRRMIADDDDRMDWWHTLTSDEMAAANADWITIRPMEIL